MEPAAIARQPKIDAQFDRIDRWLLAHHADLVARVRDLVAFPTLSPPGRNTGAAQDCVADWLRSLGCDVEKVKVG